MQLPAVKIPAAVRLGKTRAGTRKRGKTPHGGTPRHVVRLIARGRRAAARAGLRVPPLDVRVVKRLPRGRYGETWTDGATVRIDLTPAGCGADTVAHGLAHAVLEPILGRTDGHREDVPSALWGVVYGLLYRALVA